MTTFPDIAVIKINEGFNIYAVYEDCLAAPHIIPKGFATDFASIPRFLWSILPPHGLAMPASVLHDFHHTTHPFDGGETPVKLQRLLADNEFKKNLIAAGVSKLQAQTMFAAVRLFGAYRFKHYGKSRKTVRHEYKITLNRIDKEL